MEKTNYKPLILCVLFLVIVVIGCTLWTKWQNRPLLGNTDEEICETIARTEKVKKATIDLKQVKDGEIDGHTYRCALYVTEDDTNHPTLAMFRQDEDGNFLWYEGKLSRFSHVYAMPDPPDTQVDVYRFSLEEEFYYFCYVTGEDVAYLADGAGNSYAVGGIRPALLAFLPYWDNLDTEYLDAQGNPLW